MPNKLKGEIAKKVLLGLGGAALAGAGSYGGFKAGKHVGANQAANAMANAFTAANEIENQQIAQEYYNQGLSDSIKTSSLSIEDRAFINELEKVGFPTKKILEKGQKAIDALKGVIKTSPEKAKELATTYGKSWKNLYSGAGRIGDASISTIKGPNAFTSASRSEQAKGIIKRIKELPQSTKAALSTIGAAGLAGGAGYALRGKENEKISSYDQALADELEKLGFNVPVGAAWKGLTGVAKTVGQSFKNIPESISKYRSSMALAKQSPMGTEASRAMAGNLAKQELIGNLKTKSKAALGIMGGAGAAGAAYGVGRATSGNNQNQ